MSETKVIHISGSYLEVFKRLRLTEIIFGKPQDPQTYSNALSIDIERTGGFYSPVFFSDEIKRILSKTSHLSSFHYAQGNLTGKVFNLLADRFQITNFEKNGSIDVIGHDFTYIDDQQVPCGFSIHAVRDDLDPNVPLKNRPYYFVVAHIKGTNKEINEREVDVFISEILLEEEYSPKFIPKKVDPLDKRDKLEEEIIAKSEENSLPESNLKETIISSGSLMAAIRDVIQVDSLKNRLDGLFNEEDIINLEKIVELKSNITKENLYNCDSKWKNEIEPLFTAAVNRAETDPLLMKLVTSLKDAVIMDPNFFREDQYQINLARINESLKLILDDRNNILEASGKQRVGNEIDIKQLNDYLKDLQLPYELQAGPTLDEIIGSFDQKKIIAFAIALAFAHEKKGYHNHLSNLFWQRNLPLVLGTATSLLIAAGLVLILSGFFAPVGIAVIGVGATILLVQALIAAALSLGGVCLLANELALKDSALYKNENKILAKYQMLYQTLSEGITSPLIAEEDEKKGTTP